MKGLHAAILVSVLVLGAGVAIATPPAPGKHFDCSDSPSGTTSCATDDTGCVSETKADPTGVANTLECGDGISKAFGKAIAAVGKCHKAQVAAAFKGSPIDDEACETGVGAATPGKSAKEKLDAAISKLATKGVCTSTQLTLAAAEETVLFAPKTTPGSLDAINGQVYCQGTNDVDPGGDDAGKVPDGPNGKATLACEESFAGSLSKFVSAVIKCHIKMNAAFFAGKDFDERACEESDLVKHKSALEKFESAMTTLDGKGTCTDPCNSHANRSALAGSVLALVEAANAVAYPCPTTTTTTSTTVTTTTTSTCPAPGMACSCSGGTPTQFRFQTVIGSGTCGQLSSDTASNMFPLACGGLYFGGAAVGIPLPATVPDYGQSISHACCDGTTLSLTGTGPAEAGGNLCSGGSSHHNPCNSNADCPGGACKFLQCTDAGCLYGPPLPIPNGSHGGAATSTCVINTVTADLTGTADCSTGEAHNVNLPLASGIFLTGDLMSMRCSGGTTPGANCTGGGGCGTVQAGSCPGGSCVNDTGRCTSDGAPCCADADCSSGTCETGACQGGTNNGKGCITDANCPSGSCKTFIQPCPICNATTNTCNGGANDGLVCTPGDTIANGDFPTSHDCPPPPPANIGALPIGYNLDTATISKTATDLPDQMNVFCGFCRNKVTNTFKHPAVPCTSNADCTAVTGFTTCGQRTSGAFTSIDVVRTIVENGSPATGVMTGGAPVPAGLVSIFCIPPTFNSLVDSAADLPGPGAVHLPVNVSLVP